MERGAWTDERLDDLSTRVDAGFARVDADLRDLRQELHQGLGSLRAESGATRSELTARIDALQKTTLQLFGTMVVGFLTVIATVIASG